MVRLENFVEGAYRRGSAAVEVTGEVFKKYESPLQLRRRLMERMTRSPDDGTNDLETKLAMQEKEINLLHVENAELKEQCATAQQAMRQKRGLKRSQRCHAAGWRC